MGFMNLVGLTALIGIPIIIILYLLRPKNVDHVLPSLYLWKVMANEIESASQLQKFKSSILMFLQIAAVLLLALMLAGLFRKSGDLPERAILMVDCSVSMQSKDIEPSRMEFAKEQAIAYVDSLGKDAQVTLVALKDIPEILINDETDHNLVTSTIEELYSVDSYSDMELAVQTGYALQNDTETTIVYFGDRTYPGAENIMIKKSDDNVGVYDVAYTRYESAGEVSVLADLFNESSKAVSVPISLYADDLLLDAKQVEIEPKSSAKVFFNGVPIDTKTLKVQIDREDILVVDNEAFTIVTQETVKKAVLVTNSNVFLEKIFKLNKAITLYIAKPDAMGTLKDFDLYIYDGVLPETLPTDGNILMFNPPESSEFEVLGHAKNPEIYTVGHQITEHLNQVDFAIGLTQIYEVPSWGTEILGTEYGTCAFSGNFNGVRVAIFGFDLHNTDLPLVVDFPIMMTDTLSYLVSNSMLQAPSIASGEAMSVRIAPSTEEAYILTPDGLKESLDLASDEALYKNTFQTGIYSAIQISKGVETLEQFAVNVPKNLSKDLAAEGENIKNSETTNRKSLKTILGILVIVIMLIEWFIYQWRRKINAIRF